MGKKKIGKRFILLPYRHAMGRLWKATLLLGILLIVAWWQGANGELPMFNVPLGPWGLLAGLVVLFFSAFAFLTRKMSYVQAHPDHLRIVTPFLRLKISYRRILSVRPVELHQLFPPRQIGWAAREGLAPFYGKTFVFVELTEYPLSPKLLRLFLASTMFHPKDTGLVLIVSDWMALSTEIDSLRGGWQETLRPEKVGLGLYK